MSSLIRQISCTARFRFRFRFPSLMPTLGRDIAGGAICLPVDRSLAHIRATNSAKDANADAYKSMIIVDADKIDNKKNLRVTASTHIHTPVDCNMFHRDTNKMTRAVSTSSPLPSLLPISAPSRTMCTDRCPKINAATATSIWHGTRRRRRATDDDSDDKRVEL